MYVHILADIDKEAPLRRQSSSNETPTWGRKRDTLSEVGHSGQQAGSSQGNPAVRERGPHSEVARRGGGGEVRAGSQRAADAQERHRVESAQPIVRPRNSWRRQQVPAPPPARRPRAAAVAASMPPRRPPKSACKVALWCPASLKAGPSTGAPRATARGRTATGCRPPPSAALAAPGKEETLPPPGKEETHLLPPSQLAGVQLPLRLPRALAENTALSPAMDMGAAGVRVERRQGRGARRRRGAWSGAETIRGQSAAGGERDRAGEPGGRRQRAAARRLQRRVVKQLLHGARVVVGRDEEAEVEALQHVELKGVEVGEGQAADLGPATILVWCVNDKFGRKHKRHQKQPLEGERVEDQTVVALSQALYVMKRNQDAAVIRVRILENSFYNDDAEKVALYPE
eukprot:CAMPEP_0113701974 /NCGR_PEP_ID=MMETSP0038_2-20120614/24895_1 /TAXON_ID=2898 /ORGANISM="Cryptomonas paramecium" /LENGTH=400 /DNA_ID=CAMNT_0000625971 /DNA_START=42 /DNA_END=1247 /DNA_ORIENTATION=- /assembly_acc=CAM_ASM_000170